MLAVYSCVLGKKELVAVLAPCSCLLGEKGAGRCADCLLVCARVRWSWSMCWLSAHVCYGKKELVDVLAVCSCVLHIGKRELVAVLAVCSCVLGEEGAGRCAG